MTWAEILELIKIESDFLDTLDLEQYLKSQGTIRELMDFLEDKYSAEYKNFLQDKQKNNITEAWLFDGGMTEDDFVQYLKIKYPNYNYYEVNPPSYLCYQSK